MIISLIKLNTWICQKKYYFLSFIIVVLNFKRIWYLLDIQLQFFKRINRIDKAIYQQIQCKDMKFVTELKDGRIETPKMFP